ncbi:zinc finger protein 692-like [Discoglossus pictus]
MENTLSQDKQAAIRREKRRLLDARRGKCRVRLGCHLDEWCSLKEHLGFSLHSQLAKFLLDSYKSATNTGSPDPARISLLSVSVPSLHRLALSCHQHGRDCHFAPSILSKTSSEELQGTQDLLWGCRAEHQFHWDPQEKGIKNEKQPDSTKTSERQAEQPESKISQGNDKSPEEERQEVGDKQLEDAECEGVSEYETVLIQSSGSEERLSSDPPETSNSKINKLETLDAPQSTSGTEGLKESGSKGTKRCIPQNPSRVSKRQREDSSFQTTAALPVPCRRSSRRMKVVGVTMDEREEVVEKGTCKPLEQSPEEGRTSSKTQGSDTGSVPEPSSDMEKFTDIAPIQELSPESALVMDWEREERQESEVKSHSMDTKRLSPVTTRPPVDEELAQICKKRIRQATPREILLCEFEGCGKIFSKRQYLNYHQKYQHMNQRTFRCSSADCGRTFNFKKHLKEHEKRHSDRRDFICEFCARAFRSSSNLIIHRRIHTGEKPLQCEFCGFTCRQKASLNWHMKKHDADSFYQFPCDICGQRFEKRDNLAAHRSRKHPSPHETTHQETIQWVATENTSEIAPQKILPPEMASKTAPQETVESIMSPECLDRNGGVDEEHQETAPRSEGTALDPESVSAQISLVIIL